MDADDILDKHGIEYMLIEQDRPTRKCQDSAEERGVSETEIVKSLIIREDGECTHCLLPGDRDLDEEKLDGDIEMVADAEVEEMTGCEPGTVHPFSSDCRLIIDERLLEREKLSFTAGDPYRGIIISQEQFLEALQREFEVDDISSKELSESQRYASEHGITPSEANDILDNDDADLFEDLASRVGTGAASTFIRFMERAREGEQDPADLTAAQLEEVIEGTSSEEQTRSAIVSLLRGEEPKMDNSIDLDAIIENVLGDHQEAVQDYHDGEDSALNHLIGQVMKESSGRADPEETRERLLAELQS